MSATEMAKGEGNTERSGKEILALMERYSMLCWIVDFWWVECELIDYDDNAMLWIFFYLFMTGIGGLIRACTKERGCLGPLWLGRNRWKWQFHCISCMSFGNNCERKLILVHVNVWLVYLIIAVAQSHATRAVLY